MASEEMIQVLRNRGVFAYGDEEDIEGHADEWEDNDFSPAQADGWIEAGCYRAADAREMADEGIEAAEVAGDYDSEHNHGLSIGYAVANGDLTVTDAKRIAKEVV